ncbi:Pfs, NB-ARC and TPR domain protein [Aspergillus terreus]|uniref:Pfs, NB-ARC and TPR domain protein n=1 Tax=Aspergillus terreus TaxID=33178 RepID=A0A5M3Z9K6_ASPTE|nr:hypothetical protein ATETN484_0012024500 [Aspergillus terreus]GFF19493.1 Pfs, NB-ARC and TPR domain protein [Aspergillus terreus]
MLEMVALTHKRQDKLQDAENLLMSIGHRAEKLSGPQDQRTLAIIKELCYVQMLQGKFADAEENFRRVLEGYENLHGPVDPATLRIKVNLGVLYERAGRSDAQDLLLQVLADYHKTLGPHAKGTSQAAFRIGTTFMFTGKLKEAEKLLQESLNTRETELGQDDPATHESIEALALCYQAQGRFREAKDTFRRIRCACTNESGFCPSTSICASFMFAELYWDHGKKEEAWALYEEFLVLLEHYDHIRELDPYRRVAARRLMEKET